MLRQWLCGVKIRGDGGRYEAGGCRDNLKKIARVHTHSYSCMRSLNKRKVLTKCGGQAEDGRVVITAVCGGMFSNSDQVGN